MGLFEILVIGAIVVVVIAAGTWWTRRNRVNSVSPVTTGTTQPVDPVVTDPTIEPVVEKPESDPVHSSRV